MSQTDAPRGEEGGWLFLRPEAVPQRWWDRSLEVRMVPLLPQEAEEILTGEPAAPEIGPEDEPLVRLLARGLSARVIAAELGMPLRSVERRLARLRRRFDVRSTAELAASLAKHGFS